MTTRRARGGAGAGAILWPVGALALAGVLALNGCAGSGGSEAPTPDIATASDPPATLSPASTETPAAPATPSPAAEPITPPATDEPDTPTASPALTACAPNDVPVPADAVPVTIDDVDDDGLPDSAFSSEADGFAYGIRTASGATVLLADDLAGPGGHHGWTARLEGGVVTVLDDGRTATLHAFADCGFVTTTDAEGRPYTFGLNGFSDAGTGVACADDRLFGLLATRGDDGRYRIARTRIELFEQGRVADGGAPEAVAEDLAIDDPQVTSAMRSTCGDAPIVSTSGR